MVKAPVAVSSNRGPRYPAGVLFVCPDCSATGECKFSTQFDGGEVVVKRKGTVVMVWNHNQNVTGKGSNSLGPGGTKH